VYVCVFMRCRSPKVTHDTGVVEIEEDTDIRGELFRIGEIETDDDFVDIITNW